MNFKKFFKTINDVAKETKKTKVTIFFDIVSCGLKYEAGYVDYKLFEMYNMTKEERKTVITRGINNKLIKKYNNPNEMKYFSSKIRFNQKFSKYINRDWLEINDNYKDFEKFCQKYKTIIVKPDNASCGSGVEKIDTTKKDLKKLYNKLLDNKQILIEEEAGQCKELSKLHPYSINTIRIVTFLGEVVVAFLRIGNNKNNVDNFNHDGLLAKIDIDTGEINFPAIDKKKNIYNIHPLTKEKIKGIKIPRWEEVKNLCIKASQEIKEVGYIGWDVCIGEKKCFFIEGNEFPGHDLYALPAHRTKNEGLLPLFEEVIERNEKK